MQAVLVSAMASFENLLPIFPCTIRKNFKHLYLSVGHDIEELMRTCFPRRKSDIQ